MQEAYAASEQADPAGCACLIRAPSTRRPTSTTVACGTLCDFACTRSLMVQRFPRRTDSEPRSTASAWRLPFGFLLSGQSVSQSVSGQRNPLHVHKSSPILPKGFVHVAARNACIAVGLRQFRRRSRYADMEKAFSIANGPSSPWYLFVNASQNSPEASCTSDKVPVVQKCLHQQSCAPTTISAALRTKTPVR